MSLRCHGVVGVAQPLSHCVRQRRVLPDEHVVRKRSRCRDERERQSEGRRSCQRRGDERQVSLHSLGRGPGEGQQHGEWRQQTDEGDGRVQEPVLPMRDVRASFAPDDRMNPEEEGSSDVRKHQIEQEQCAHGRPGPVVPTEVAGDARQS